MSGIRFTRPDGLPIYINSEFVAAVSTVPDGYAPHAKTLIVEESGEKMPVREELETVIKMLGWIDDEDKLRHPSLK